MAPTDTPNLTADEFIRAIENTPSPELALEMAFDFAPSPFDAMPYGDLRRVYAYAVSHGILSGEYRVKLSDMIRYRQMLVGRQRMGVPDVTETIYIRSVDPNGKNIVTAHNVIVAPVTRFESYGVGMKKKDEPLPPSTARLPRLPNGMRWHRGQLNVLDVLTVHSDHHPRDMLITGLVEYLSDVLLPNADAWLPVLAEQASVFRGLAYMLESVIEVIENSPLKNKPVTNPTTDGTMFHPEISPSHDDGGDDPHNPLRWGA